MSFIDNLVLFSLDSFREGFVQFPLRDYRWALPLSTPLLRLGLRRLLQPGYEDGFPRVAGTTPGLLRGLVSPRPGLLSLLSALGCFCLPRPVAQILTRLFRGMQTV